MGAIYGSSYYTIVDGPSWTEAEEQANALGGNLASIDSADENQYISRSFKDVNKAYYGGAADQDIYWIGLNKKSGSWEWSDGSNFNFRNWGPLEPYEDSGINDRAEMTVEAHGGPWLQTAGNWNNNSDLISPKGRYGIAEIPLSYFSIADASFREGKGGDITITRSGGTTTSQTLRVKSSDGTATTADDDYAAINKTVSFAAGETSKTISVSTTADLDVEDDETFNLTITPEGADDVPPQISDRTAKDTIKADDFKRGDSLYTIVDGPSWTEAENEAKRLGGNLVTINDLAENSYLVNKTKYSFDESNSIMFSTRKNKTTDLTEYYNFIYQYKNDCLAASIEYNKDYYDDRDIKPEENIFFKLTIIPFGETSSPNLKN